MSLFDRLLQQAASPRLDRLLQYGVASPLAKKAEAAGLTTTMIRSLSQGVMVKKFGLEAPEAAELKKCVARQPTRGRGRRAAGPRQSTLLRLQGPKRRRRDCAPHSRVRAVPRITDTPTSRSFAPTTTIAPTMAG